MVLDQVKVGEQYQGMAMESGVQSRTGSVVEEKSRESRVKSRGQTIRFRTRDESVPSSSGWAKATVSKGGVGGFFSLEEFEVEVKN